MNGVKKTKEKCKTEAVRRAERDILSLCRCSYNVYFFQPAFAANFGGIIIVVHLPANRRTHDVYIKK